MIPNKDWSTMRKLMVLEGIAGGKAVEAEATGNPVTFLTDLAKPLKSLVANFLPIQASGTPSPDNILPITGWTGVNVFHSGANLIDDTKKYQYSSTTVYIGANNSGKDIFLKAGKYTVTRDFGGKTIGLYYVKRDSATEKTIFNASATETTKTITIAEDGYYGIFCYRSGASGGVSASDIVSVMFQYGETATAYESYNETVYPVTWSSEGTVYGGYVDLVTGEVWGTWQAYTFTGEEQMDIGSYSGTGGIRINSSSLDSLAPKYGTGMSNKAAKEASAPSQITRLGFRISGGTSLLAFFVPDSMFDGEATVEKFKSWLSENELTICIELSTPVLIATLTPQQITALIGNNTVWSDANGDCEIKFLKKG